MKTTQILIAGFGGQDVLFAGKFLAYKGLVQDSRFPGFLPTAPKCAAAQPTAP